MRLDSSLAFVPVGAALSLVGGTGISIASTNTIDLLGQGVGTAPVNIFGTPSTFGAPDAMGGDGLHPVLEIATGTAFTTSNSCTLNVALQAAADQGSAGSYQPSTWYTLGETGAIAVANLTANTVIGRLPWLPPFPANLRPRFLRLYFQVPSTGSFTAGTIAFALPTFVRDDQFNKYAAKNYTVA
jgi:hypothetical protein